MYVMKKSIFKGIFIGVLFLVALPALVAAGKEYGGRKIRLIDYNILNGMWYDQYNDYDRFVFWVNSMAPDVLTLCEGATH